MSDHKPDEGHADEYCHHNPWPEEGNTGHIWDDDIRELDNPPPLWWMLSFYAGFILIIFYTVYYPSIPLVTTHTPGISGWTQVGEYHENFQVLRDWRQRNFADKEERLAALSVGEILRDPELTQYAVATSRMLFGDYCAACHGMGGAGVPFFPVLADDVWLWGGTVEQIEASISKGRIGNMPARGMMGNLTDLEVEQVADFVIALAEGAGGEVQFAAGKAIYSKGMCMACHGVDGKPMAPAGATDLTDSVWRFSSDRNEVIRVIKHGVNVKAEGRLTVDGVMPPFNERLPDAEINVKRLAIYVHQLGGGQ